MALIRITLLDDANNVAQQEELEFDSCEAATEFFEELLAEIESEDDGELDDVDEPDDE